MSRCIALIAVWVVVFTSAAHANIIKGPGAPTTSGNNHASDFSGVRQQATTGIHLEAGQDLLKLTFWGRYKTGTPPLMDAFTLRIWGPSTGLTNKPSGTDTGAAFYNQSVSPTRTGYGPLPSLFQYVLDVTASPIPFNSTGDYFISVVNNISADNQLSWSSASGSTGNRYNRESDTGNWTLNSFGDLAFQSEHAPEPGSIGMLSVAALGMLYGRWRRRKKRQQTVA
jgi:hypothetical protein